MISTARNLEPDCRYLTIRLRLEQQRLYNWSSEVGLLRYLEEGEDVITENGLKGISRSTMLDTLEQIQVMAHDFIKCIHDSGGLVPDDSAGGWEWIGEHSDEETLHHFPQMMRFLRKKPRDTPLSIRKLPKRLKWVSFYKDKYEGLIKRLQEFNDILIDLVDSEARIAIGKITRETNTTVLHTHSKIDELAHLVKALSFNGVCPCSSFDINATLHACPPSLQYRHELAALAYFKAISTSIHNDAPFVFEHRSLGSTHRGDLKLAKDDLKIGCAFDKPNGRWEAVYHGCDEPNRSVWVEWRDYDPTALPRIDMKRIRSTRVEQLAALLREPSKPDFLRVPQCLGYFEDARGRKDDYFRKIRLGFVFEKPNPATRNPVSLRNLVKCKEKPLLTERISLAKTLSNSLMSLHSVNWLHKSLRSHNVIFFPSEDGTVDYTSPFLSGFGYSRPAFRRDMTEIPSQNPEHDMYRHPKMQGFGPWEEGPGFKRTFDIYSLGVILIEIANWQTIDEILQLGDLSLLENHDLKKIQNRLLDEPKYVYAVGSNAGRRFQDATLCCVKGAPGFDVAITDDETSEYIAATLSNKFYHLVLRRLEEIRT